MGTEHEEIDRIHATHRASTGPSAPSTCPMNSLKALCRIQRTTTTTIVLPVDVDDVAAVALERDRGRRGARERRLRARVEEPVHVAVAVVRRAGRTRHVDPLLRDDLAILPLPVAQEEIAEARHVARRDEHAAAPVAAAGHRLDAPAVEIDPRVLVAVPAPRARRADRLHDLLAQKLRQRPPQHLQRGEREHVDARIVVLVARAGLAQLAIRPVGWRLTLRAIRPVGLAPDRALPVARLAQQVLPRDLRVVRPFEELAARRHVVTARDR